MKSVKQNILLPILTILFLVFFVYIIANMYRLYVLKEGMTDLLPNKIMDYAGLGDNKAPKQPTVSNPALWGQVIKNSNMGGYDIGTSTSKPILSLDECLKQCQDTEGCVEVVHGTAYGKDNNCYMKCREGWGAPGSANGLDVHVMKNANIKQVDINSKKSCHATGKCVAYVDNLARFGNPALINIANQDCPKIKNSTSCGPLPQLFGGSTPACYWKPTPPPPPPPVYPTCQMHEGTVWAMCGSKPIYRWGCGNPGDKCKGDIGNCNYEASNKKKWGACK